MDEDIFNNQSTSLSPDPPSVSGTQSNNQSTNDVTIEGESVPAQQDDVVLPEPEPASVELGVVNPEQSLPEIDLTNLNINEEPVADVPTLRINKNHPLENVIGPVDAGFYTESPWFNQSMPAYWFHISRGTQGCGCSDERFKLG